jgi:hypothetical protein
MVCNENGKAWIFEPKCDPILKRRYNSRSAFDDLHKFYMNRLVKIPVLDKNGEPKLDEDGKPKFKYHKVAQFWLEHWGRRQYLGGVVFRPRQKVPKDTLNLWEGYGVAPKPGGSWARLAEHIRHIICRDNDRHFAWLLDWIARMLQYPGERAEVAIVIRGPEGAGKTLLGEVLCRLIGQHAMVINHPTHLVGRFNKHLRDCIFLLANEAFFAGDHSHVRILKSLVTDQLLTVEGKHVDVVLVANLLHIMLTTNETWAVAGSRQDRRYFVLDASDERLNDKAYFRAIWNELENGGLEAMLYDLLKRDLAKFDHRQRPETAGIQDQKKHSYKTHEIWWEEVLQRGYVWKSRLGLEEYFQRWMDPVTTELLYASYREDVKGRHERHPLSREMFGRFMLEVGGRACRPQSAIVGERSVDVRDPDNPSRVHREAQAFWQQDPRPHAYRFGNLIDARKAFEKYTGLPTTWGDEGIEDDEADTQGP